MDIYYKKSRWKIFLFLTAVIIGSGSLWYTNQLVKQLANEERKKVELWAEATKRIIEDEATSAGYEFLLSVIKNNETVPVIVTDQNDKMMYSRNLDSVKITQEKYYKRRLDEMKEYAEPIKIELPGDQRQYIYYSRSTILTQLLYYPYIQLAVICLFVLVSYFAFSASRKAEQNQVWVGLSKETAHQLGTPISSLLAWIEIAREEMKNSPMLDEFEKDIRRLEKITERFSKIGSQATLQNQSLQDVIHNAIHYIQNRTSQNIQFEQIIDTHVKVPINAELFEWVIENICKNAIDAMEGKGVLTLKTTIASDSVYLDISDTGKGLPKSAFKTIFKPGYTTKSRGWGLGLSLARRIIEDYHYGKIFVLQSETGKGTTFRITLNTQ
ncbi:MAG: ATP-binding protein [Bacteroidetes bacterium]|nr:ATP-binding protein [Bacteroidota bacterium]